MPEALKLSLPARPTSVSKARKAVARAAEHLLAPTRASAVALMVSEVVTNSVVHGAADQPLELTVRSSEESLRVEVVDHGPGIGLGERAPEPMQDTEGGYGLFLVEQLADRWGWEHDDVTRVWFEVDLIRPSCEAAMA